jgi:hypothetical protein
MSKKENIIQSILTQLALTGKDITMVGQDLYRMPINSLAIIDTKLKGGIWAKNPATEAPSIPNP